MPAIKLKLSLSSTNPTSSLPSASTNNIPPADPSSSSSGSNAPKAEVPDTPKVKGKGKGKANAANGDHQTPNGSAGGALEDAIPGGEKHDGPSTSTSVTTPKPTPAKRGRPPGSTTGSGTGKRKGKPLNPPRKKQKPNANAYSGLGTPSSAVGTPSSSSRPSAIPHHVLSSGTTPIHSPSQMAPPPLPFASPSPASPSPYIKEGSPSQAYGEHSGYGTATPAPATPAASDVYVKDEPMDGEGDDDEPLSPDPLETPYTPADETPVPMETMRGRTGGKVVRHKKPLSHFADKVMRELRKKDEYDLFGEPVNTEEYPGYLAAIGGEQNMMDLSTMQTKIDNGEYRTIDHLKADLELLVQSATTFNRAGTVPHMSANKLLAHGLKHIERARPLVLSPSPSPTRTEDRDRFSGAGMGTGPGTPWRDRSVLSGREHTHPPEEHQAVRIPPKKYIPVEMLEYPPNSLQALAVGWNLNGGKRVYAKREIRAREKFSGRWRRWAPDGSREVDEMEDVSDIFMASKTDQYSSFGNAGTSRTVPNWRALREYQNDKEADKTKADGQKEKENWWDWQGYGGQTGQPPLPFTNLPLRPTLPTRTLGHLDFGVMPDIESHIAYLRQRDHAHGVLNQEEDEATAEASVGNILAEDLLAEDLRPERPRYPKRGVDPSERAYHSHYAEPMGRTSADWLGDIVLGDVKGEAYMRSVRAFIDGAIASAKRTDVDVDAEAAVQSEGNVDGALDSKMELGSKSIKATPTKELDANELEGVEEMERYVLEKYNEGMMPSGWSWLVNDTLRAVQQLIASSSSSISSLNSSPTPSDLERWDDSDDISELHPSPLLASIRAAQARAELRPILNPGDPFDLKPLFRQADEFFRPGRAGTEGLKDALAWVGEGLRVVGGAQGTERVRKGRRCASGSSITSISHLPTAVPSANGTSTTNGAKGVSTQTSEINTEIKGTAAGGGVGVDLKKEINGPKRDPYGPLPCLLTHSSSGTAEDVRAEDFARALDRYVLTREQVGLYDTPAPSAPAVASSSAKSTMSTAQDKQEASAEDARQLQLLPYGADVALLRLEILGLARYYPLPGVKKFSRKDAERLLPPQVQKLLTGEK